MDPKNLAEFKAKLEERQKNIISKLESVGHRVSGEEVNFHADFPDYGDSEEDNAIEVADYTKNLSFEKGLEKELRDIESALSKVETGKYGLCAYCGKEISTERLMIRPESNSCVDCKKTLKNEN